MKKLLLTIAVGMLMLSLPVIASANTLEVATSTAGFTNYSGHAASITIHGFSAYTTSAGLTGRKPFSKIFASTTNTVKNTWGYFDTISIGNNYFQFETQLNSTTWMEIDGENPISNPNGTSIFTNAEFEIYNTSGGAAITSSDGWNWSYSGNGDLRYLYGAATIVVARNPYTGNLVMSFKNPVVSWIATATVTSGSPSGWLYWNPTFIVTGINIQPIKLNPSPATGYAGAWWQ
ncbi:MAG: hypothetical protein ACYDFU_04965 [Nitrospirota bacterium]